MSNLHSKQTGTQLHKPQKHTEAETESLLLKTKDNSVGYVSCYNSYSTIITPTADVGGSLNNKYFCLYSKHGSQKYAVWYNCSSAGTLTLPKGYDELIEVSITNGASVAAIIDETKTILDGLSENYVLYDSFTDNTTSFRITQTNSPVVTDVTTGWLINTTTTANTTDQVLITEGSSNELKFIPLAEKIADTVGAMVTGNTETNIAVTYDDADNTLDFNVTGGGGDITGVRLNADTGEASEYALGNAAFTIAGGTGLETSSNSLTRTITIALSEEKKSKSDIDTLSGVTGTNLGTFTGGTIVDNTNIKTALQALETKAEKEATSSAKGIARYGSDFTVTSGNVSLAQVSHTTKSFRWSANNLDGTANETDEYTFAETNNNAHNRFFTNVDTSAMSYQIGGKGCVEMAIAGMNHDLIGGTLMHSGENGVSYNIKVYKAHFSSTEENMPITLMGTFSITGTANTNTDVVAISLADGSDRVISEGYGVVIIMDGIAEQSDMDCRGTITLRFKDTNA